MKMVELTQFKQFKLKMVFYLHFFLVTLISLGNVPITSFLLYNIIFVLCLMYGIDRPDYEAPLQVALGLNLVSIPLDILFVSLNYFPHGRGIFALVMAIILLICRPFTSYLLATIIQERLGVTGPIKIGQLFSPRIRPNGIQSQQAFY